jgi:WD40 repeat protein
LACVRCAPDFPETGHDLLSAWLSADGRTAYVTYSRTVGGREWRLDRWTPDPTAKTEGRIEHLAVSHEPVADRVVAASRDGRVVLTDPGRRPPVLRHAPGYEGVPLLAPPLIAAVFSEDERLVVTGHGDGRIRLWEAGSGRFEGSSPE